MSTGLSLQDNSLNRFEEGVFKSMLQDIYAGDAAAGYERYIVYVSGSMNYLTLIMSILLVFSC